MGTVGGRDGALDAGAYDQRVTLDAANPNRWQHSNYIHSICPIDLYESGTVREQLEDLLDREFVQDDNYYCGRVMQDVPGTAQGCWFLAGSRSPSFEDAHLALVWHNENPMMQVISMGTSMAGLKPKAFLFEPRDQ